MIEHGVGWIEGLRYRVFGRRVRTRACEMAAVVLSTRKDVEPLAPLAFSLVVFFETYMWAGAKATAEDFGPRKPVRLRVVRSRRNRRGSDEEG